MAPLQYDETSPHKAVFLVTIPISFGRFELSERSYNLLAKHVGMSLDSVSHWAVCVIDRGVEPRLADGHLDFCYDLMSDRLEFSALGKNYFRVAEITAAFVKSWSSCYYVGETTKTHHEIQQVGLAHMDLHPRYSLLSNNCQHLVDTLVKELCNGKIISQAKLEEELSLASPQIARDLMVAKFKSKLELKEKKEKKGPDKTKEDEEKEEKEENETIREYLDAIKKLWEDKMGSEKGSQHGP
ncbi:hypothetical protein B0T10DRAFT_404573 [Thelonectria olida]|uniref:PPPDE domain-containing protein n=1 Tax=Thelonectria olida TaxID=1576542 RepID=A0A9P8W4F1_9HYPO|nr:hypothetical protein B0T10DRAFT_404573 [Thelonectria olida]